MHSAGEKLEPMRDKPLKKKAYVLYSQIPIFKKRYHEQSHNHHDIDKTWT
jgi:hypothetical protein